MDQIMIWITAFGIIILPVVGWIFNALITNKINELNKKYEELEKKLDEEKQSLFSQLNGLRQSIESTYVRKDIYEQAIEWHTLNNDEKFKSLLGIMNTQFGNMEGKIDDLKNLINDKFNGKDKCSHP